MRAVAYVSALLLTLLAVSCPLFGVPDEAPASQPEAKVILREIALMGATQVPLSAQDAVRTDLLARDYKVPDWTREVTERIRDAWQRKGYFRADVELLHEVLGGNGALIEVVAVANIEEGQQYRFGELRWKNGAAFSPAELRPLFPLIEGELFDPDKIRQGLEALRKLYATNGYINFTPVSETEFDDAQGIINLEVDLDEGDQFRVGNIEFHSRDAALKAKLMSSWKLKVGDVYDPEFVWIFFLENADVLPDEFTASECIRVRHDVRAKTVHLRFFLDGPPLSGDRFSARESVESREDRESVPSLRRRD